MNIDFNFSKEGHEIALMAIAFNVGNVAAAKALGDLNRERKAAQRPDGVDEDGVDQIKTAVAIDAFSDFANGVADDVENDNTREEQGLDRQVTFVEYCVLLAAINDELEKLGKPTANGGRWPRPQTVSGILDWKVKATPGTVRPNQLEEMKVLLSAFTGNGAAITEAELTELTKQDNAAKAEVFANMFAEHRLDIETRMEAGILNYNRFSETSWETLFNNLPARIKYFLLGSVDFKIEDKCKELLTGKLRNGSISKGANRPALVRAAEITVLRGDQTKIRDQRLTLAPVAVAA
jgi:hypothetical protein